MDFWKSIKGGTLWVSRGSNPWGGRKRPPPPPLPPKSAPGSTYVLTVLDLFFCFFDQNQVCFDCARPMFFYLFFRIFRISRPKLGMFRLFRPKSGMLGICARLKVASRPLSFSRKKELVRLSKGAGWDQKTKLFFLSFVHLTKMDNPVHIFHCFMQQ